MKFAGDLLFVGFGNPSAVALRAMADTGGRSLFALMHSVFREWIPHASMGYSSAKPEEWKWTKPETLVHGANKKGKYEYGIFYHRLFIDRKSNLYIAFTFFEFKSDKKGNYPETLIIS